ncbi:MAG: type II toxin-antitoxin system Phd/YefM family antitoxin [Deltaproteobacteria bacterium]|nr:type II toxin-antitoxin system Phd/YefM family antitoxin [Deltaproteobacteria bacterium]
MRIASVADVKAHFSTFLKESKRGPVVVTKNGRPAAVLLSVEDEDEIDRLTMAYSPKLQKILTLARRQIKEHGGIPHDDFWKDVDER